MTPKKLSGDDLELWEALKAVSKPMTDPPETCTSQDSWDGCDESHWKYDYEKKTLVRCPCFFQLQRKKVVQSFINSMPKRIQRKHEPRKSQRAALEVLYPRDPTVLPEKGAWLWGESRYGKSHLVYHAILRLLRNLKKVPAVYVIKAKPLMNMWVDQYSDERAKAKDEIQKMFDADIVFVDDIDKTGTMTASREAEFYELFNELHESEKLVYFTSQKSIYDFCNQMESERLEIAKGNKAPRMERLRELCCEVECVTDTQEKLL